MVPKFQSKESLMLRRDVVGTEKRVLRKERKFLWNEW